MPLDFMFRIHHMTLLVKLLVMILGLTGVKNNDIIIWITSSYFLNALFDQQLNFKNDFPGWIILCLDKQKTPKEGWRTQQLKRPSIHFWHK